MTYNMTILGNAENFSDLLIYANDSTSQILVGSFMLGIFFIMLMKLKTYDFDSALLASSFSCFVLSGLLVYAGLLNLIFPLVFLALMAFDMFYMVVIKRN